MTDTLWIAGTQEDTATVDLGILSTSQRSDPLLRTTSSTINSLWAGKRNEKKERKKEAPKRWTMGGGKENGEPNTGACYRKAVVQQRDTRDDGPL